MGSVVEFYPWSKRGKYMMELDPSNTALSSKVLLFNNK